LPEFVAVVVGYIIADIMVFAGIIFFILNGVLTRASTLKMGIRFMMLALATVHVLATQPIRRADSNSLLTLDLIIAGLLFLSVRTARSEPFFWRRGVDGTPRSEPPSSQKSVPHSGR
jgi:Ca2+/Na+ antiporter